MCLIALPSCWALTCACVCCYCGIPSAVVSFCVGFSTDSTSSCCRYSWGRGALQFGWYGGDVLATWVSSLLVVNLLLPRVVPNQSSDVGASFDNICAVGAAKLLGSALRAFGAMLAYMLHDRCADLAWPLCWGAVCTALVDKVLLLHPLPCIARSVCSQSVTPAAQSISVQGGAAVCVVSHHGRPVCCFMHF